MRAILIDPSERTISEAEVPPFTSEIRGHLGGKLERVATLPNGDSINVVASHCDESFCIGGSRNYRGVGIILGRGRANGVLKSARSDLDAIVNLTVFGVGTDATRAFGRGRESVNPRSVNRD
jgi:hypothetical protein